MHTDPLNLVGQIYDAVSEPKGWNTFLENTSRSVGAIAARMRVFDKRSNNYRLIAGSGHDNAFDAQYQAYYSSLDPWNPILAQTKPGLAVSSSHILPDRELIRTEIYSELWKPYEVTYGLGGNIINSDDVIARIGIHRAHSQGEYGEKEIQLLQTLMPHLLRAFKLGSHLEKIKSQCDSLQEAFYHSSSPLILFDEYGRIAFISQRAEELLGLESGLSIVNSRLATLNVAEQAELNRLLDEAVSTGTHKGIGNGGALRLSSVNGEMRYNLLITPYPARPASHLGINRRICAAAFIHDTQQSGKLPADTLRTLYHLTPSEIRLAEAIVAGLSPAEAAARYGVSVNTTRSQLRSLFAKTDTQRQAELVKLLLGLST